MTKLSKTREQLVQMYLDALRKDRIPWRSRWSNSLNRNGYTNMVYSGVNQLLLSLVGSDRQYKDSRWYTYLQVKKMGYKLKNAHGKGVPVEFWMVYDTEEKKTITFQEYEEILNTNSIEKDRYKVRCHTTCVFNGSLVEGLPESDINIKMQHVRIHDFISNAIKNLNVKYSEHGDKAYYSLKRDEIVLPSREKFVDEYSYYATQLHELCHSTMHKKRLARGGNNRDKSDYAREELIAEISSSFLMQKLNIDVKSQHFDNHKAYIQSWIKILEDSTQEFFKAVNESYKVCDYIENNSKSKLKERVR